MPDAQKRSPNRLDKEKSPYLRQHALNPVDWYPWGEEAFGRAREEHKPVFLSIGYSTCHWCHVMEKESFEDPEVARLLNDSFISIKVDREERPDLDHHYMDICQGLTGSGGWPLTVVMTPDRKPFFAGTYFPRERRYGRIGMIELLPILRQAWDERRNEILRSAEEISSLFGEERKAAGRVRIGEEVLDEVFRQLSSDFDGKNGGFGHAPKFPPTHYISFLLRFWKRRGEPHALEMAEKTLQAMELGGIHDHLGFGFHRYSTDDRWLVPHFEKMLYDQALLAMAYTEAWQATGKEEYRRTACETLGYVLRDLASSRGGFYSAEDADSEGEEGKFYLWTIKEVEEALAPAVKTAATRLKIEDGQKAEAKKEAGIDLNLVRRLFCLEPEGNFHDAHAPKAARNILYLDRPLRKSETEFGIEAGQAQKILERARNILFASREKRIRPLRDEKILTDWNGLMIAALALAGRAFGEPRFIEAARKAADFILGARAAGLEPDPDGLRPLHHVWIEGEAKIHGFLDDYAFMAWGLLNLYEATFDVRYLQASMDCVRYAIRHFWDEASGGLFFTPDGSRDLAVRGKEASDGAVPSGNAVMYMNLLRLGRMTGLVEMEERAARVGSAFSGEITPHPRAFSRFLCGLDFALGPSAEVVLVADKMGEDTRRFLKPLGETYLPNVVVLFRPTGSGDDEISRLAPFTRDMKAAEGAVAAYICPGGRCLPPVSDPEELLRSLGAKAAS